MAVRLNHTIIHSRDQRAAADFYSAVFGLPKPTTFGPFLDVMTSNDVTLAFLDFTEADGELMMQHYAFLVSEREFDEIFGRVKDRKLEYWADPMLAKKGEINRHDGGRGVYFKDPSGHLLEIITRPYGGGG